MTGPFDPITIGSLTCPNRIWMAPLTRGRGTRDHVPTALMAQYYAQRASAGLIISEATGISLEGSGWPYAGGLWAPEHVAHWRVVTDAVHIAGGRIFAQLWHMGRVVHPALHGVHPVSASATTAPGNARTYDGLMPFVEARALDIKEIPRLVADYAAAAINAIRAGFDGIQLHAANGYLIDQFLRDSSNQRTDAYGGAINNRIRLLHEVVTAIIDAIGNHRTAVRLSPNGPAQGVDDANQDALFAAAAVALNDMQVAFLELRETNVINTGIERPLVAPRIRKLFTGPLVLNSGYNLPSATEAIASGAADAITFGRHFLANPDLPHRFADGLRLNQADPNTFYTQGSEGYTTYPAASTA
jgi:N-ethylmaleimide reductase